MAYTLITDAGNFTWGRQFGLCLKGNKIGEGHSSPLCISLHVRGELSCSISIGGRGLSSGSSSEVGSKLGL